MIAFSRRYSKLCDVRDFEDAALLGAIRSLVPERDPTAHIERKVWEFGMVMLLLEEAGYLDGRSRVLSVGAGNERLLFWLTNRVGEIVATDIYGEGRFADGEAQLSMLEDPAAHVPAYAWRPERLEVRKMDARRLVLITDCFVRRHPLNAAPVDFAVRVATLGRRRVLATPRRRAVLGEIFTRRELERLIVRPSGLIALEPLDARISADSERYPLIVVCGGRSLFTSACLVLVKPAPDNPGADAEL